MVTIRIIAKHKRAEKSIENLMKESSRKVIMKIENNKPMTLTITLKGMINHVANKFVDTLRDAYIKHTEKELISMGCKPGDYKVIVE